MVMTPSPRTIPPINDAASKPLPLGHGNCVVSDAVVPFEVVSVVAVEAALLDVSGTVTLEPLPDGVVLPVVIGSTDMTVVGAAVVVSLDAWQRSRHSDAVSFSSWQPVAFAVDCSHHVQLLVSQHSVSFNSTLQFPFSLSNRSCALVSISKKPCSRKTGRRKSNTLLFVSISSQIDRATRSFAKSLHVEDHRSKFGCIG